MRIIISLLLLIISISGIAQQPGLRTVLINEKYSWGTISEEQYDSFYFNLVPVRISNYKIHIRISLTGQTIDLYSLDGQTYSGILTNYIMEYATVKVKGQNYKNSKKYQYYIQQIKLEPVKVKLVVKALISSGQNLIPTDTLINYWKKYFLHCGSVRFKFKVNGQYNNQSFHCPWGQNDTVQYRNVIMSNIELLDSALQLDSFYSTLKSQLPKGKTYSKDGYRMMYIMTENQSRKWRDSEPYRNYLDSVKHKLNNYLSDTLTTIFKTFDNFNCYNEFFLYFSNKNKLKKIKTNRKPHDLTEKIEFYKCKKKIRRAFRKVEIDFINSKVGYRKVFNYYERNVRISQ